MALLLLAWWQRPSDWRREIPPLLPFFAMSLAISVVGWWREQLYHNPPLPLSLPERLLIMNRALWFYVGKLLWPTPLTPIYPRWEMQVTLWSCALLGLTLGAVGLLWALRGAPAGDRWWPRGSSSSCSARCLAWSTSTILSTRSLPTIFNTCRAPV